jgi:hypothetical protein
MVNKNIQQKRKEKLKFDWNEKWFRNLPKQKQLCKYEIENYTQILNMWRDEFAYEIACIVKCTKCLDIKYGPGLIKYIMLGKMTSDMDNW